MKNIIIDFSYQSKMYFGIETFILYGIKLVEHAHLV